MIRAARAVGPLLAPVALVTAVVWLVAGLGSPELQSTTLAMLINLIVVVGLYIFVGNSGIVSFGHVAFMAIGAYVGALLTIPPLQKRVLFEEFPEAGRFILDTNFDPVLASIVAGLAAAALAFAIGFPLMRLDGLAAGMATFAMLIIVNVVIANWEAVTQGTSTVIGVPPHATLWNALAVAILAMIAAFLFQVSRRGIMLQGSREDAIAAESVGVDTARERWLALCISAFVVGVGGSMYAYYIPFQAEDFYLSLTVFTLAMLIIGGTRSLWGAVVGTVVVSALFELLRTVEAGVSIGSTSVTMPPGSAEVALGVAMLAMLLFRPDGLTGGAELNPVDAVMRRLKAKPPESNGDDDVIVATEHGR